MTRRNIYRCECAWHKCTLRSDVNEKPIKCIYGLQDPMWYRWSVAPAEQKTLGDVDV